MPVTIEYRCQHATRPGSHRIAALGRAWLLTDYRNESLALPLRAAPLSETLLTSVASAEPGAAERCLDRYGALAWTIARRYFAAHSDAEDAVQEAFVSLWKNAKRYDPAIASEGTFVTMIFRRRMIDLLRKSQRRPAKSNSPDAELVAVESSEPSLDVSDEAQRVREHMRALSDEQRRVIELGVCQGLSQSRIAELTGWPLGTVKSHARRGMQRLRELINATSTTTAKEATR